MGADGGHARKVAAQVTDHIEAMYPAAAEVVARNGGLARFPEVFISLEIGPSKNTAALNAPMRSRQRVERKSGARPTEGCSGGRDPGGLSRRGLGGPSSSRDPQQGFSHYPDSLRHGAGSLAGDAEH